MPTKTKLQGFQFFQRPSRQMHMEPVVAITKTGNITFNKAVLKELKVDPQWVEFLYNPESYELGVLFVPEKTENAYKVRFTRSGTLQVGAESVLTYYNIDHTERRAIEPIIEDDFIRLPLKS